MIKETHAVVERIRRINETHQQLDLGLGSDSSLMQIKAGQSVLARLGDGWDPYLREQWWPVGVANGVLTVERPAESIYEPGQVINLIGAIGQPFRFRRTLRNVLLIVYETEPAPLILMIHALLANRISVTLILLGTASVYTTAHLPAEVEVITGDTEMSWPNRVTTVGWADQVFVVTPQADEIGHFRRIWDLFTQLRAEIPQSYLFGVFRPLLPCGLGACSACMLRIRGNSALACTQGPAFDLTQVLLG
jgi:NAD(P)H-flavin reductase